MEEYLLSMIRKNEPMNALKLYANITRDKQQQVFGKATLPEELLTALRQLENDEKIVWTNEGISCLV